MARLQKRPPGSKQQTRKELEIIWKKGVQQLHKLKAAVRSQGNTREQAQEQDLEQQRFSAARKLIPNIPFRKSNIIKGVKAKFHRGFNKNNEESPAAVGNGEQNMLALSTKSNVLDLLRC
ncbi:hypothetical protein EV356DRAFT_510099 [Viridothelium virens]|uniref:Uncharacterized protein n=1 Tax=Viridothelium virens TaxID=1048519 RepID=A0A6A6GVR8_VIRVR|nr:hypothetical protein EV356DRAFT_510099 [Viridothelium virens]